LHSYATHPGLLGIAYVTEIEAVRVGADGQVLWRLDLGPPVSHSYSAHVGCGFSRDGGLVWIYRPDAMINRGADRIRVVNTSGVVVAETQTRRTGIRSRSDAPTGPTHKLGRISSPQRSKCMVWES
jgi:hypothetical protein